MLDLKIVQDPTNGKKWLATNMMGKPLLTTPQLNKGTAFTEEERHIFGLTGKLPLRVESLDEQVQRAYMQLGSYETTLKKHIYLNNLHNKNRVLFYELVSRHLEEMMPIIYTPIVGKAVKEFSNEFREPRGLYIPYPQASMIEEILDNRSNPEIDLIVVTDGERVLGIGDQGIGGMDIPIAKLMVYTLCGGIDPLRTLPILLDVGTNNALLIDNPLYLGWRHARIRGEEYDQFIKAFVMAVKKKFPNVFLHWEDFGRDNARRHLEMYRETICTFNDDMQGTGVVTLAALIAAVKATGSTLADQRIVVFGGGTAGTGVSDQIVDGMLRAGLTREEAYQRFWIIDRNGLLVNDMDNLTKEQKPYARTRKELSGWSVKNPAHIDLLDIVNHIKPTALIGCSAVAGAFTEEAIRTMAKHVKRPIILPLSNPNECCEAQPEDLFKWTNGEVLIATGSPFAPVTYNGREITIGQCNNAFVFLGIGLGILASHATRLTENMLWAACDALTLCTPISKDPHASLLPSLGDASKVANHIALAVAEQAQKDGVAVIVSREEMITRIEKTRWKPGYLPFKKSTE